MAENQHNAICSLNKPILLSYSLSAIITQEHFRLGQSDSGNGITSCPFSTVNCRVRACLTLSPPAQSPHPPQIRLLLDDVDACVWPQPPSPAIRAMHKTSRRGCDILVIDLKPSRMADSPAFREIQCRAQ
ncbi:hypothetical protein ECG_00567 [Echinococcus granulosus]|nr:hypothetical protein ECG_00567 [Echinococcus granulosus]